MKSPNKPISKRNDSSLPKRAIAKVSRKLTKKQPAPVAEVLQLLAQKFPNPRCELYYETPFQLLVSVVLSAQTTDKSVNRCMEPLYRKKLGPDCILKMGEDRFREAIKSIGLAPTKARNVINLSRIIINEYGGVIPSTRQELEALPGVGRKTANVILGEIFREPTLAVDTHVFRVGARLGWHHENNPQKAEIALLKKIDTRWLPDAHHWLILHGRYTCTARAPQCHSCEINRLCPSALTIDSRNRLSH